MPSVVTNDGTRSRVVMRPLTSPMPAAIAQRQQDRRDRRHVVEVDRVVHEVRAPARHHADRHVDLAADQQEHDADRDDRGRRGGLGDVAQVVVVRKIGVEAWKYTTRPSATTRTLASRRRRNASPAHRHQRRPGAVRLRSSDPLNRYDGRACLGRRRSRPAWAGTVIRLHRQLCNRSGVRDRARPLDQLQRGVGTLVAGLGALVRVDVVLGDEQQAGVGLGREDQTAGQLVQVQRQDRQEALQVGLLVDGVVQVAGLDGVQCLGDAGRSRRRP